MPKTMPDFHPPIFTKNQVSFFTFFIRSLARFGMCGAAQGQEGVQVRRRLLLAVRRRGWTQVVVVVVNRARLGLPAQGALQDCEVSARWLLARA